MSYIFSENHIKQKLRRLEEISEYNKARLALFNRKQTFMSRKEYERIKKVIFGTDYQSERESLQASQNQDNQIKGQHIHNQIKQTKTTSAQTSKPKRKNKSVAQAAGNIVHSSTNKNKQLVGNQTSQETQNGGYQQRQQNGNVAQNNWNNQIYYDMPADPNDQRYATPKQEDYRNHAISQDQADQSNKQMNMMTFNSAGQNMNTFNPEMIQDSLLQQTHNYEEFDFEQQQLIRNIKKIELEKEELENELTDLNLKAANLNLNYSNHRKSQRSLFDKVFKDSEEYQPYEYKSLINLMKVSPRQSPNKLRPTSRIQEQLQKQPNYRQMEKNIGLDFETQWDLLEKWESLNQKYPITTPNHLYSTEPILRQDEQFARQDNSSKGNFWDYINQAKKEKQGVVQQNKPVHSFLPQEENWETRFNNIGKTQQEKQRIVDKEINFGRDQMGRKNSSNSINNQIGTYVVNRYTIDRLSDDIDMLMRYSKIHASPFSSVHSHSPFKNKRSLFEIPEEFSQDNSVNY